uniref:Protein JTB n=1 Tax=Chelonoidis abingdonii TaxID=106734 RepID=A0A8C0G6Q7_CHEAB
MAVAELSLPGLGKWGPPEARGPCGQLVPPLCSPAAPTAGPVRLDRALNLSPLFSVSPLVTTLCWQAEDFVIVQDCAPCTIFQAKTMPECSMTGFIEQISCAVSKKEEYKR